MNPIPITIGGETTLVPRLRIQQIIDLSTRRFERDRLEIVTDAMGGELPQQFASISPDEMSRLALGCIGVELEEKAEGSAEGKAQA